MFEHLIRNKSIVIQNSNPIVVKKIGINIYNFFSSSLFYIWREPKYGCGGLKGACFRVSTLTLLLVLLLLKHAPTLHNCGFEYFVYTKKVWKFGHFLMGRHPPQFSGGIFLIHKIYCHFSAVSIGLLSRDNMMTTFSIISCDQKTKFMSYFCFKLFGV